MYRLGFTICGLFDLVCLGILVCLLLTFRSLLYCGLIYLFLWLFFVGFVVWYLVGFDLIWICYGCLEFGFGFSDILWFLCSVTLLVVFRITGLFGGALWVFAVGCFVV